MHRTIALVAAVGALAAFPAGAMAKPGISDVRDEAKQARAALADVRQGVRRGNVSAIAEGVRANRKHSRRAVRTARRVSRKGQRGTKRVARAMKVAGGQLDANLATYTGMLDDVSPGLQFPFVEAIDLSFDHQAFVINMLTKLAERLPDGASEKVLEAVARFESDGDVAALVDALADPVVIDDVKLILLERLDEVLGRVDGLIDRLEGLTGRNFDFLTPIVDRITERIEGISERLGSILETALGVVAGGGLGGGLLGSLCDSSEGLLGSLDGILGTRVTQRSFSGFGFLDSFCGAPSNG